MSFISHILQCPYLPTYLLYLILEQMGKGYGETLLRLIVDVNIDPLALVSLPIVMISLCLSIYSLLLFVHTFDGLIVLKSNLR